MSRIRNFVANIEKISKPWVWVISSILFLLVGLLDLSLGFEVESSLFYLLPIGLVAWALGRRSGLFASVIGALIGFLVEWQFLPKNPQFFLTVWNFWINLGFYTIVATLLSELRKELERIKALTRTDFLTGAASARFFYELLQAEMDRLTRYKRVFSMAYIDIDNFKSINDTLGHGIGDTVLNEIVRQTQMTLRDTDVIARLGGDEFALLLPETDQAGAQIVIQKIQQNLMAVMQANQWPVTFSIGLATFLSSPGTAEDALKMVDGLMYDVKKTSKNGIKSQQYRMSASSILDPTEKTRS